VPCPASQQSVDHGPMPWSTCGCRQQCILFWGGRVLLSSVMMDVLTVFTLEKGDRRRCGVLFFSRRGATRMYRRLAFRCPCSLDDREEGVQSEGRTLNSFELNIKVGVSSFMPRVAVPFSPSAALGFGRRKQAWNNGGVEGGKEGRYRSQFLLWHTHL